MTSFRGDFPNFPAEDREEDRKPNIAQLDLLHEAFRKRSRSIDEDSDRGNKAMRSNIGTPVFSHSNSVSRFSSAVNSPAPFSPPYTEPEPPPSVQSLADEEVNIEFPETVTPTTTNGQVFADEPTVMGKCQPITLRN